MANETIFRSLSDGTDVAYAMDSIRLESDNRTITLFSSLKDTFFSQIQLPSYSGGSGSEPIAGVYNFDQYCPTANRGDCTNYLDTLLMEVLDNGGGTIKFGTGTYVFEPISLPSNITLEGLGPGKTIFRRKINVAGLGENDSIYSCKGLFHIPAGAVNITIKGITFDGYGTLAASDDQHFQMAPNVTFNDTNNVNAIHIDSTDASSKGDNSTTINPYRVVTGNQLADIYGDQAGTSLPNKFINIEDVIIIGFSGSGIYIGGNVTGISLRNVRLQSNKYAGIVSLGSRNQFNNIIACGNYRNGIYVGGVDDVLNNVISMYNGIGDHANSAGIYINGNRIQISNTNSRYNYCTGININGLGTNISAVLDSNGSMRTSEGVDTVAPTAANQVPQLSVQGSCHRIETSIHNTKHTGAIASKAFAATVTNTIASIFLDTNAGNSNSTFNALDITGSTFNNSGESAGATNLVTVLVK